MHDKNKIFSNQNYEKLSQLYATVSQNNYDQHYDLLYNA